MALKTIIISFGVLEENGGLYFNVKYDSFIQKITCISVHVTKSVV